MNHLFAVSLGINTYLVNRCMARSSCTGCIFMTNMCMFKYEADLKGEYRVMVPRNFIEPIQTECEKFFECFDECIFYTPDKCLGGIMIENYSNRKN